MSVNASVGTSASDRPASGWSVRGASGGPTDDGDRYRIRWWAARRHYVKKKALFSVGDGRVAVLVYIWTVRVSQRVEKRVADMDTSPRLDDVPERYRARMRADGFTPTQGVASA